MPRRRRRARRGAAHYAAPVAFLAGVTIAVLLVHSAFDGRKSTTTGTRPASTARASVTTTTHRTAGKKVYVVQTGDTFGTIAAKVGISIERLQALNPGVSSNVLQVGQKLRTR